MTKGFLNRLAARALGDAPAARLAPMLTPDSIPVSLPSAFEPARYPNPIGPGPHRPAFEKPVDAISPHGSVLEAKNVHAHQAQGNVFPEKTSEDDTNGSGRRDGIPAATRERDAAMPLRPVQQPAQQTDGLPARLEPAKEIQENAHNTGTGNRLANTSASEGVDAPEPEKAAAIVTQDQDASLPAYAVSTGQETAVHPSSSFGAGVIGRETDEKLQSRSGSPDNAADKTAAGDHSRDALLSKRQDRDNPFDDEIQGAWKTKIESPAPLRTLTAPEAPERYATETELRTQSKKDDAGSDAKHRGGRSAGLSPETSLQTPKPEAGPPQSGNQMTAGQSMRRSDITEAFSARAADELLVPPSSGKETASALKSEQRDRSASESAVVMPAAQPGKRGAEKEVTIVPAAHFPAQERAEPLRAAPVESPALITGPRDGARINAGMPARDHEPPVIVHIGRIEVRAVMAQSPPPPRAVQKGPRLSLDEYLKQRGERGT